MSRPVLQFWRHLAASPLLLYPILFLAGILASLLPIMRAGIILPHEYDEFAYLLGAQTFLDGRLANPPHPLAPFFQTLHVLQQPTYASKYPPGQSLQLAAGFLMGHPIFGVWVTIGLLAVAAAWMLRAVAPATWAALGGLLAAWQWGALTYWGRTYWGGSLFALAGMLVFGGMLRFVRRPSASSAGWAAVGAAIMALTRPYEGLWFCLIPALVMLARFAREIHAGTSRVVLTRWAMVGAAPLIAALVFLLIYNRAVTGDALTFPHQLYEKEVMPDVGLFVWDTPGPAPRNRHPEITYQLHRFDAGLLNQPNVSLADLLRYDFSTVLPLFAGFYLPGLFGLGLVWAIFGSQAWRRPAGRWALASFASLFAMMLTVRFFGFQHYAAAWAAPLAVLIALGFRGLCAFRWRGWRLRPGWLGLVLVAWAVATLIHQTARGTFPPPWTLDRLVLTGNLEDQSALDHRGHVVFVMPAEGQPTFAEWVYNGPDIDAQPVIFARSLGPALDATVARYYPTRHLWQAWLKPDGELDRLTPYAPAAPVGLTPPP
ncbi:MAG: hypothetical protein ABSH19_08230 [Opitutales bacterium]